MALSQDEVRHVAWLARLRLTPEEESRFGEQLGRVLEYVAVLDELDVEGIEPMAHPMSAHKPERKDECRPGLSREEALEGAPQAVAGGFAVPRIIE